MAQPKYPPLELSSSQASMLSAIFDTVLAQLTPEEEQAIQQKIQGRHDIYQVSSNQVAAMSQLSATSLQIPSVVVDFFSNHVAPDKRADLLRVLDILATRPGSFLLTGYWKPLPELSRQQREAVLLTWKNSSLQSLRNLFKILSNLCLYNAYSRTRSPLVDSIGHDAAHGDVFFETHPDYEPVEHARIPMMQTEEATQDGLAFDVVVVGSGAGGGVAAAELAKAGYSVLVIEKGKYYHQSEMVHEEETCYANMYDGGTSTTSTSGSIQCLSGATLGGGTALNYLVSLKPQHFVREEWAKLGLGYFASTQFSRDLDTVFDRIGASQDNILETKTNGRFEQGCHELGYPIEKVFVNTGGKAHHCSRCMMGCKAGIKNSTANTWLMDAWHHGARFLDKTLVTRIVTNNKNNNKAIGVECLVHNVQKPVFIRAKKVIAACGALRTPGLLKASGLSNSNIGKHLRLQPIMFGFGFFDETMRQMDGPLISRVCNASDDCHGDHYGAKIEEGLMLPGGLASKVPWYGAAKHKELMLRHKSVASFVNVVRDKDSVGVVTFDPNSPTPVYEYALSKHDAKSLTICIQRNMRILAAAGARELYTSQANVEGFAFHDDEASRADNPRFNQCRMGTLPKSSVVQPTGETWECKNIYIADGSVLPTAVGVNPMVTIEAIALHVSRQVISTLAASSRL
ncbi:hypothetical protein MBANPS3_003586 [Mucor bainieri]